ncbi:MAG TPA: lipase maturation factor family protein [Vicinamibacterales bacterium]|jgi:hypothetical protein|nr:lipase maturation factor family protein [Vicinamibacterales bacterium]
MRITPTYSVGTWVFLRLLGIIYLCAFWSLAVQIVGLAGHDGILPARLYMDSARAWAAAENVGLDRFRVLPTLCWFGASDAFLKSLCVAGVVLALLLIAGVVPIVTLPLLWLDYLSLVVVGREFLSYQWDVLLLETGLLSIVLAPIAWRDRLRDRMPPQRLAVWLMLWLLFRLILGSGLVKLASGDPTWRSLTAMLYHYETQPIPTPPAWYAHQLPAWVHEASTFATLAIELVVPFFMFGPRRLRQIAFGLFIGLQALVAITGNYAFFNLLSASLCVFLIDDETIGIGVAQAFRPARIQRAIVIAIAAMTFPVSVLAFTNGVGLPLPIARLVEPVAEFIAPFRSVNSYGLFAVMTTTRPEIVVEGSDDGATWLAYEFKYKAGDLQRRPPWVAPHQPRLDWQMWFAALSRYEDEPWFRNFLLRLLDGSPDVRRLLARDPFDGRAPRYVRGVVYRYRFSDRETRRRDGVWWTREMSGEYSPALSLR